MKIICFLILFIISAGLIFSCKDDLNELLNKESMFIQVTSISPIPNITNVSRSTDITISFSQVIDTATFANAFSIIYTVGSVPLINYTVTWNTGNTQVTLSAPTTLLPSQTFINKYSVT